MQAQNRPRIASPMGAFVEARAQPQTVFAVPEYLSLGVHLIEALLGRRIERDDQSKQHIQEPQRNETGAVNPPPPKHQP